MYYKDELVYIGYFHSSKQENDVRAQRWRKELATITIRGEWVKVNPKANHVSIYFDRLSISNSTSLFRLIRMSSGLNISDLLHLINSNKLLFDLDDL